MFDTLVRVDVKRPLPDGRKQLVMTGAFLLKKLVPLIGHHVCAQSARRREDAVHSFIT
jgi:hypothetical protein